MTTGIPNADPPPDRHDRELIANVHPADWVNPTPQPRYNLVVIGAGTAGLVTAAGAARLGAKVALVERHRMGGDCLNVGCVPSKAIIRSARAVADVREAHRYGIRNLGEPTVDFSAVMERMRAIRSEISHHDSAARFRDLGVDVFLGGARFSGRDAIKVGGQTLRFAKAVIATGTRPHVPDIPGLAEAGFLTNETVFDLTECPKRMVVVGGGPIGCELAQAFQRLGSRVTLIAAGGQILPREDSDAAKIVHRALARDGVDFLFDARIPRVDVVDGVKQVAVRIGTDEQTIPADTILVGAGRAPNVNGFGFEAAGVDFDMREGVRVDDHLRTSNSRIFAAGDVCMKYKFTHAADAAARIVIQNALFGFAGRKRLSALTIPWCTYTDPEIAHVGLSEKDADEQGVSIDTIQIPMDDVDRAIAEGETEGLLKVHLRKGTDKIAGATIVARHAGEMIGELTLAMMAGVGLGTIANVIHPYPTQAEIIKKAADTYNRTRLTPMVKTVLASIIKWQR